MRQIPIYCDERLLGSGCTYCGAAQETGDHVPPKVFLDAPYPENLPKVPACRSCNGSFSMDEEYLACLVEGVRAGTTDPQRLERRKIQRILTRKPKLAARLEDARITSESGVIFLPEEPRVRELVVRLARAHTVFELQEPQLAKPTSVEFVPRHVLPAQELHDFEVPPDPSIWPEMGTRAMQRLVVAEDLVVGGWVQVQEGRYRYYVSPAGELVRIVLSEYLAAEVIWP